MSSGGDLWSCSSSSVACTPFSSAICVFQDRAIFMLLIHVQLGRTMASNTAPASPEKRAANAVREHRSRGGRLGWT